MCICVFASDGGRSMKGKCWLHCMLDHKHINNIYKQNLNLSYSWKVWRECNFTLYVLMNDIPIDLVFQTGIQIIPTGEWTMHQASHKLVPITHSDDKLQITGVLTVFLPTADLQGKDCALSPKTYYSN